MVLGRVAHYAFDAVLISTVLAGIKRSTGLTPTSLKAASMPNSPKNTDTEQNVQAWLDRYLGVGEWVMDQSIAVMSSSSYFERRRS
ncbi:uncharacterized protein HMPREF1541_06706 [Cyphellophora europaea CBS 101466]|uniref:DUF1748-domain-containing protein n=1 Tax=Cyphellophora europaea (strain CBS 101466) TaxID=1220924 RepID=W2RSG3_CYPE1|nr:uncharacterized protein HMPREF1541_06706 [Cyphellophora europaea CBS 101466]ETN38669.1 hypothetical protein HMPREF1541_06706 [Cyphellophora europaea CBS 101466]